MKIEDMSMTDWFVFSRTMQPTFQRFGKCIIKVIKETKKKHAFTADESKDMGIEVAEPRTVEINRTLIERTEIHRIEVERVEV